MKGVRLCIECQKIQDKRNKY
ncbi:MULTISPECIES: hypothetical protein [Gammaproteobacteria]